MKKIITFIIYLSSIVFAQFSEIKEVPYSVFISEENASAKILDNGNDTLMCFWANDSVFYSLSTDNGQTWSEPLYLGMAEQIDALFYNNKIFALFPTQSVLISDDYGSTWQGPYELPRPSYHYYSIEHSDKFYVFLDTDPIRYYSSEDGTNWGDLGSVAITNFKAFDFLEFSEDNYLLAVVYNENENDVIKVLQANSLNGMWETFATPFTAISSETISNVKASKTPDGKYWIAFTKTDSIANGQKDIFYITSEDGGITWSEPEQFTKSYKDDVLLSLSASNDAPIVGFYSKRGTKLYYGKLSVTEDSNIVPFVEIIEKSYEVNYGTNEYTGFAKVRAFSWNGIKSVQLVDIDNLSGLQVELYDDGAHNDGEAGDSIYAGTISLTLHEGEIKNIGVMVKQELVPLEIVVSCFTFIYNDDNLGENSCIMTNAHMKLSFNNKGEIGTSYYDDNSVIFSAGFLLSGYSNGELWANGVAPSARIVDYVSGNVESPEEDKIYYVKASDPAFGESWQNWAEAVNKGAYFRDGNGDGVYNPVDLNGNGIWDEGLEDAPDIKGNITAWCVYNDGVPPEERRFTGVEPQGIEVRQTIWTKRQNELKNTFFIRYSIYNTGSVAETLDSVYIGIWNDNDVGNYNNDLVGCKPSLFTSYTYDSGFDELFIYNSPTVANTILNVKNSATGKFFDLDTLNGSFIQFMMSHPTQGDPDNMEQARNHLLGFNSEGEEIDPCDWTFGTVINDDCSTIDGRWMYSGNPVDSVGWINTFPTDQRSTLNVGPFTIQSGESVDVTYAYHVSRGETCLESVTLALAKAQYIRDNADVLGTEENKNALPSKFNLSQNYPNPFNPTTTIAYSIPSVVSRSETTKQSAVNVILTVYNILGQKIATLVNTKQTPGKYTVLFNGSDLSSGVYFYRLRAGDFIATKKMILLK